MKTLHTALRIRDLERSIQFYETFGFREIGRVNLDGGSLLLMFNLPGDGAVVTLELVHNPVGDQVEIGNGLSHIAIQVDDLESTLAHLAWHGIKCNGPHYPGGEHGPITADLIDPDGYRFELVQWPAGHPAAMTRSDFAD